MLKRENNPLWPEIAPKLTRYQHAYISLISAADRARSAFERFYEPYGITGQQYNVLRILRGAGPDGLPTLTIAERMIERAPGITRMIDRLTAKGLVTRQTRADDRRCVQCRITIKGLELLKELDGPVEQGNRRVVRGLTEAECATLTRLLTKLREPLERESERKMS
jgi:MarR family transcriptional regulator, organic hydroperoxide resistance regulator